MSYFVLFCWLFIRCMQAVVKELICLLSFTCNYVVSVRRGFLFPGCLGWAVIFYCGTP